MSTLGEFGDLLALLMLGEVPSECPGEFASEEQSPLAGSLVGVACSSGPLLLVEDCKVSRDILSDSLDFGELGSTA